jgi:hypothetical protein
MATQTTTTTAIVEDDIQMRRLGRKVMIDEESTTTQALKVEGRGHPELTGIDSTEAQSGPTENAHDYPTGIRFWLIILTLGALLILGGLDTNIVATAVPRYVNGVHVEFKETLNYQKDHALTASRPAIA